MCWKRLWLAAMALALGTAVSVLGPGNRGALYGQTECPPGNTGNCAPSGAHYNLNIIGVPKAKSPNMTGGNGHRIFVDLYTKKDEVTGVSTRIKLIQSYDGTFQVLDANGTDGVAEFMLPEPGEYEIWARPLGKPGGQAWMTTCAEDIVDEFGNPIEDPTTVICSTNTEHLIVYDKGPRKFRNVTDNLTTIVLDEGSEAALACGKTEVSLFADCLYEYFWNYENDGLRLLQLRFYKVD